jgi:hypothetical protein
LVVALLVWWAWRRKARNEHTHTRTDVASFRMGRGGRGITVRIFRGSNPFAGHTRDVEGWWPWRRVVVVTTMMAAAAAAAVAETVAATVAVATAAVAVVVVAHVCGLAVVVAMVAVASMAAAWRRQSLVATS